MEKDLSLLFNKLKLSCCFEDITEVDEMFKNLYLDKPKVYTDDELEEFFQEREQAIKNILQDKELIEFAKYIEYNMIKQLKGN